MKVEFTDHFIKVFRKRFGNDEKITIAFEERLKLFSENSSSRLLRDHKLKGGKLGLRAFSVTGDIRVVYFIHKGVAYFFDIGTHNQVY